MADPLKPSPTLLCKLGSIIIHADEGCGQRGHPLDLDAMRALLRDRDVAAWLVAMNKLAMLPKRRTDG